MPTPKITTGPPVIASGARADHLDEADALMRSVQTYLPHHRLIMYDLDLSSNEKFLVGVEICFVFYFFSLWVMLVN